MLCRSSFCTISRNDCDVAEQKMKKVPSFLPCRLLNCGRVSIFAPQSRTKASQIGRLAQLVQSVCLTSRGSGVRIPQRPHSFRQLSIGRWIAVFLCTNETEGVGEPYASLAVGCAQNRHRQAVPSCVLRGMSVGCSFSSERVCAVAVGVWGAPPRETDRWVALFSEKAERKREKTGEVEHFFPAFYPTFRTTVYSSL